MRTQLKSVLPLTMPAGVRLTKVELQRALIQFCGFRKHLRAKEGYPSSDL
jgi:hypothetical protein